MAEVEQLEANVERKRRGVELREHRARADRSRTWPRTESTSSRRGRASSSHRADREAPARPVRERRGDSTLEVISARRASTTSSPARCDRASVEPGRADPADGQAYRKEVETRRSSLQKLARIRPGSSPSTRREVLHRVADSPTASSSWRPSRTRSRGLQVQERPTRPRSPRRRAHASGAQELAALQAQQDAASQTYEPRSSSRSALRQNGARRR